MLIKSVKSNQSRVVFEPPHDKTNNVACAPSEASAQSDQSLHSPHEESLSP